MAITLEKNTVFFRFASGSAVEKVDFHGRDIAIGDLKQAIADQKNLNRIDLVLENEATGEVYSKDGALVPRNTILIVKRTPPQSKKAGPVVDLDATQRAVVWDKSSMLALQNTSLVPAKKKPCPREYLCPVCHRLFQNPSIARCCGRSACQKCFDSNEGDTCIIDGCNCPLCGRTWTEQTTPVPNRNLAQSVAALDLSYFEVPGDSRKPPSEGGAQTTAGLQTAEQVDKLHELVMPAGTFGEQTVTLKPCALTPEQFYMWQQSLGDHDCSSSDESRKKGKSKKKKAKKAKAELEAVDVRKKEKRRRS
mmetsp:Transcript_65342/g.121808  ORF Transcript_65342/g.121808 Transcript_65342/m.121808 type:complete len:307 (-) Transcript_65342:82-1002(-)